MSPDRAGTAGTAVGPGGERSSDVARWLANRQDEIDSAFQYLALADGEPRPNVADIYRRLAAVEQKHATFWEHRLRTIRAAA